jgi:hypothetical protein
LTIGLVIILYYKEAASISKLKIIYPFLTKVIFVPPALLYNECREKAALSAGLYSVYVVFFESLTSGGIRA